VQLTTNPAVSIREICEADYPLLADYLYLAIFVPPGEEPPLKDVIYQPDVFVYIQGFGDKDDCGVVATVEITGEPDATATTGERVIGAAWTRIIDAYGHIDDTTPELAIAVQPEYRGMGVGTALMNNLFDLLRRRGYRQTSLSVQKDNPATRLYLRLGYELFGEESDYTTKEDYLMIKRL